MAKIIQGIGMSHSPMMAADGEYWLEFAKADHIHKGLFDETGKHVTYDELSTQRQGRYDELALQSSMISLHQDMKKSFARLKSDVAAKKPDVIVVIGNDHDGELFDKWNVPSLAVYYGDVIISGSLVDRVQHRGGRALLTHISEAHDHMAKGMGMDKRNEWPGSSTVGTHLIKSLMEQGFDLAALKEIEEPTYNGHGHGYGMVVQELMEPGNLIPMVPIYLNIWPPNVMSLSRCYNFGLALRSAIESIPEDIKIAVVATGGLSHFVTDEDLDLQVMAALRNRSKEDLLNLPVHRLQSGSSEIRNWIALSAVSEHLQLRWDNYLPVFRTESGTGIGMGFASFY